MHRKEYRTREQARADLFDYLERIYNPYRRHSTVGYVSPANYELVAGLRWNGFRKNGFISSFNGRLGDEYLNANEFVTLEEVRKMLPIWRQGYDHHRPHGSLGKPTPSSTRSKVRYGSRGAEILVLNATKKGPTSTAGTLWIRQLLKAGGHRNQ